MKLFKTTLVSSSSPPPAAPTVAPTVHSESPQINISLPTELWIIIINFVVDEARHPHLYCLPGTYPHFQARLFNVENPKADYVVETWKSIRAVCRTWKLLAGSSPLDHVLFGSKRNPGPSLKDISAIFAHTMWESDEMMTRLVNEPHSVTTLALGGGLFSTPSAIIQLLDHHLLFPDLACLSISRTTTERSKLFPEKGRSFWERLQNGFPRLVSLTIRQCSPEESGTFIFPNLQFLDMHAWTTFQLQCPSLKHLSVQNGCPPNVDNFLSQHGSRLQSLFLEWTDSTMLSARPELLWTMFPNMACFGSHCSFDGLHPPPDHPLRHLRLFTNRYTKAHSILSVLDSFTFITHLYITRQAMRDMSITELTEVCLGKGVQLVRVAGDEEVHISPSVVWLNPPAPSLVTDAVPPKKKIWIKEGFSWRSLWVMVGLRRASER
ncbi:hypothetical protein FRC17_011138 [Serendipita sp. 399]|nr:hypothetical protein FRC17_011138 [Serendipita sp. 399]